MRRPGKGAPDDELRRPSVDEAEGAEAQSGPRSQRDPAAVHPIRLSSLRHTMCPYLARQLSGFSTVGNKFVSIMRRAWMVSTGDNGIQTGSGLRGVTPYVQCQVAVFPS
jgi:hypothetical protein